MKYAAELREMTEEGSGCPPAWVVPKVSMPMLSDSPLAAALERWSFVVLTDLPPDDALAVSRLVDAFESLFKSPGGVKEAIAPYNTDEMPREFGYLGLELKEQVSRDRFLGGLRNAHLALRSGLG